MNINEIDLAQRKRIEVGLLAIGLLFILIAFTLSIYVSSYSPKSIAGWVGTSQLLLISGLLIVILTENWRNENFSVLCYKFLFPLLVMILVGFAYYSYPLTTQYPSGYAGLYSEFILAVQRNDFLLPMSVSLYDPSGIPFAYPPLSFYVAAAVLQVTNVSIFDYLNYMPAVIGTLALLPTCFLTSRLLSSRSSLSSTSFLAISLFVFSPVVYDSHLTAPGIVRGLAFLFSVTGILFFVIALQKRDFRHSWMIGLFFALTIVTHLTYAVFFLVSILVFSVTLVEKKDFRPFISFFLRIVLISVISSSWYWIFIVLRYEPKILLYLLSSHGNLGFLNRLNGYYFLTDFVQTLNSLDPFPGMGFMTGITTVALFYQLTKKNYILPIWFFSIFFLIGESLRFLALIGIIASADLLWDLSDAAYQKMQNPKLYFVIVSFSFSVLLLCNYLYFQHEKIPAVLNDQLVDAGQWIASNSHQDSKYLFITKNYNTYHNAGEWLPFLSRRVPVLPRWGDEWLGTYDENTARWVSFYNCYNPVTNDSYQCISKIVPANDLVLLICANDPEIIHLCSKIAKRNNSLMHYQNQEYTIFRHP